MKKMNKLTQIVIGIMLSSLLFSQSNRTVESYTVMLKANAYQIKDSKDSYQEIQMIDFGLIGIPGKPALPSKTFLVALPPGAEVISIGQTGIAQELEGIYKINPAPMQLPKNQYGDYIEKAREEYNNNLNLAYSSDDLYPSEIVRFEGMGNLRKWRFAYIKFLPFQYRPSSGKLVFYKEMTITVNYSIPSKDSKEWVKIQEGLFDTKADKQAQEILVNYQDVIKWYKTPSQQPKKGCLLGKEITRSISYCIIIPDMTYYSAVTNYQAWKTITLAPDTVFTVSVDTIEAYYPGWDRVEKIRNFLIDGLNYGLSYVLLVGDINTIPMRLCWPDPDSHTTSPDKYPVPTDFYYSDLSGNWDSDGDGYYGEMGQDNVDFLAEISAGRIPWNIPAVVQQICSKLQNFEQNTGTWKKQALMLGSVTFTSNNGGTFTDEARIMEAIKDSLLVPQGWSYWRMYEKGGTEPSPLPCEDSLCQTNVVNEWSSYPYGYVNWSAHGSHTGAYRTVNMGGYDSFPSPPIFEVVNVPALDDNYPSIVFSSACLTAYPEDANNLGKALIQNGSAGFIGATRVAFGPVGNIGWNSGGNTSYNCYFALQMMRNLLKIGDAMYASKYYYRTMHYTDVTDQHNLFVFNLYGDPAMIWQGYTGIQERLTIVSNSQCHLLLSPNPSYGEVAISYILPTDSKLSIKIYDASGRLVKTIYNGNETAGTYTKYWNSVTDRGIKCANGIYFCRMTTDDFSATTKFTIVY